MDALFWWLIVFDGGLQVKLQPTHQVYSFSISCFVKIDVYSEGNIFYVLLTGKYPFEDAGKEEAKFRVMAGKRPKIDEEFLNSKDPLIQALVTATQRCWTQNPEKRPTSREIEQFLRPFATGTYMQQQQQQQPNNS